MSVSCDPMDYTWGFSRHGVGCHALLQGIFPTQGSNPGLPLCRQILYQLSHKRSPKCPETLHIIPSPPPVSPHPSRLLSEDCTLIPCPKVLMKSITMFAICFVYAVTFSGPCVNLQVRNVFRYWVLRKSWLILQGVVFCSFFFMFSLLLWPPGSSVKLLDQLTQPGHEGPQICIAPSSLPCWSFI